MTDGEDFLRATRDANWVLAQHYKAQRDQAREDAAYWIAKVDKLEKQLKELDDWVTRMPDAGFNDQDPRWDWWHQRPRVTE